MWYWTAPIFVRTSLLAPGTGVGAGREGLADEGPQEGGGDRLSVADGHVDGRALSPLEQRGRDGDSHVAGFDITDVLEHGPADGGVSIALRMRQPTTYGPAGS